MAKRERLQIIQDILKIIHESGNSMKLTPLIRKSNLSSSRFSEYFQELLDKQFVNKVCDKDGKKEIIITEKGLRYLEKYKTIIGFIEEFEL